MSWIMSYCQDVLADPCIRCTEAEMFRAMRNTYRIRDAYDCPGCYRKARYNIIRGNNEY